MKKAMNMQKSTKKAQFETYNLGVHNGVKISLKIPSRHFNNAKKDRETKYFLESYYAQKQKQYKENVRAMYMDYLASLTSTKTKLSASEKLEELKELFSLYIMRIVDSLNISQVDKSINLNTLVVDAVNEFFKMQQQKFKLGQLSGILNYTDRNKRLNDFFGCEKYKFLRLRDLNVDIWESFRVYLLTTPTKKKPNGLENSSVNQYITYVKSLYGWLIDVKDVAGLKNHVHKSKLKKLDTSLQVSKYSKITNAELQEFFELIDCDKYLRLHLICLLTLENAVRPVQVRNIKHRDIDLENSCIKIYDAKGKKFRTIILLEKALSLVKKIYANTNDAGVNVTDDMYLIGGRNQFKKGKPSSQGDIRDLQVVKFREQYPHLEHIQIYDNKHTSITKTSKENLVATQKRAGHVKASTTQIYDKSGSFSEPVSLADLLKMD